MVTSYDGPLATGREVGVSAGQCVKCLVCAHTEHLYTKAQTSLWAPGQV